MQGWEQSDTMTDPYYLTPRWRRLRERILRRDGYQCQIALRYGKHVQATHVHHIFPRDLYPEYEWQPWNLISVSSEAHNMLHDRTTGVLTSAGVELMERTRRRLGGSPPVSRQIYN